MNFTLIVVQTRQLAEELNSCLPVDDGRSRVSAVFVGQALCGLHYGGQRPNTIITKFEVRTMKEHDWVKSVLFQIAAQDATWIEGR